MWALCVILHRQNPLDYACYTPSSEPCRFCVDSEDQYKVRLINLDLTVNER
jgi:hypothetical protein